MTDSTLFGTPDNDSLTGTNSNNSIVGLAGNDLLRGRNGNDALNGDEGNDALLGGAGRDTLSGGAGDDILDGDGDLRLFGLTDQNTIVSFDPSRLNQASSVAVTGVEGILIGLDVRPANGLIYGITDTNNLYTIDPATGSATFVSTLNLPFEAGQQSGVDFNPVPDRLRLVGNDEENLRANVDNGAVADTDPNTPGIQPDTTLAYAATDPNFGVNPNITGAAYTNSFAPSPDSNRRTTLYEIDSNLDVLVRQGGLNFPDNQPSPNGGQLFTVGSLGVDFGSATGFDIFSPANGINVAYAVSGSTLYSLDLSTGAATSLGEVGNGSFNFVGLAASTVQFGSSNDRLFGGDGNDILRGSGGDDTLLGENGSDTLTGGTGKDSLSGGDGNDSLDGGGHNDTLSGENGSDTLSGGAGNDRLNGGDGNDTLLGGTGTDLLNGENGNDSLNGGDGSDLLDSGNGNDTLVGGAGSDVLTSANGDDRLFSGDGNDVLDSGDGNDFASGGAGNDLLYAATGNDALLGGAGRDTLLGGAGDDVLDGDGDLRLFGLTSQNTIVAFDPTRPDQTSSISVTGIEGTLLGLDVRPANGVIYGITDTNNIYTIDPTTGAATFVSTLSPIEFDAGLQSGVDFNPVPDRLRLVGTNDQNLRVNVETGAIADFDPTTPGFQPDQNLSYVTTDVNTGADPTITAAAYTNAFFGPPSPTGVTPPTRTTQLFGIDSQLDTLVLQDPPNNGVLTTIGSLGVDFASTAGFDIFSPANGINLAYAVSGSTLYSLDLTTGAATSLGTIGDGSISFVGLTASNVQIGGDSDSLLGGDGNDTLRGGDGNDSLKGENGNDALNGGAGRDILTGGDGNDSFLFNSGAAFDAANFGVDRIEDFAVNSDKIVLDLTSFTALQSVAGDGFSIASEFATVASDSDVATSTALIVYSQGSNSLFYNQNGAVEGFGTGAQFATLDSVSLLVATDFQLVA